MRTRIVPVEPTEEMVEAYFKACEKHGFHHSINATTAYAAMLAHAPPVSEEMVEKVARLCCYWDATGTCHDSYCTTKCVAITPDPNSFNAARSILALINGESE